MKNVILISILALFGCNTDLIEKTNKEINQKTMKEILFSCSANILSSEDFEFSDSLRKSGWVGNKPATDNEIQTLEEKLNIELPNDYKEFLKLTNGFHALSLSDPTFLPIAEIDYLKNTYNEIISIWGNTGNIETQKQLEKSIVIAGKHEEQFFLLIPPENNSERWKYWLFAAWIPGEEEFFDLKEYFSTTLEQLESETD